MHHFFGDSLPARTSLTLCTLENTDDELHRLQLK